MRGEGSGGKGGVFWGKRGGVFRGGCLGKEERTVYASSLHFGGEFGQKSDPKWQFMVTGHCSIFCCWG